MKIIIMDSSYFHFLKDIQHLCGEFLQIAIQEKMEMLFSLFLQCLLVDTEVAVTQASLKTSC